LTTAKHDLRDRVVARLALAGEGVTIEGVTASLHITVANADLHCTAQRRTQDHRGHERHHEAGPADRALNLATYSNPRLPIEPEVTAAIGGFQRRPPETVSS
jgi:hypothetical protein